MASNIHVQKPYILTTLPRPLDPTTGRYVVGEVHGTAEGSRKRKRSEVTVGIDGEAVNIYDVSSTRLITSYPIPPQSTFTCAPTSIRRKLPGSQTISRYTWIASRDPSYQVTLFKDIVEQSGKTTSTTKSVSLPSSHPVVYLTTQLALPAKSETEALLARDEVLAVRKNGEIIALDSETLQQIWKMSPAILSQDLAQVSKPDFMIKSCVSARYSEVVNGIFKGNRESIGSLVTDSQLNADPELLLIVSSMSSDHGQIRHLHILGPTSQSQTPGQVTRGLIQLHVAPIVTDARSPDCETTYRLDARSGTLTELSAGILTVHDLTSSIPRISRQMDVENSSSFLRLSKTSILISTIHNLKILNPQYRSIQSSTPLELEGQTANEADLPALSLVAYFSNSELAIGISGLNLVAIQLEAPKSRTKKRRAEGLLIDSIGHGVSGAKRTAAGLKLQPALNFSNYLPGSMLGDYWETWTRDIQEADALLEGGELARFEALLAGKLGLQIKGTKLTNGIGHEEKSGDSSLSLPEWEWPKNRSKYPGVDRRWVIYSIGKVFQWNVQQSATPSIPSLVCLLPHTNIVSYLVDAGHLTISNLKSALRDELPEVGNMESILAEELVICLAELDPTLELLSCYISTTTLGSVELVLAVRTIMRSLELVQDPTQPPPKMLTNGTSEDIDAEAGEDAGDLGMELDNLEEEMEKIESILNGNMGVRGNGLSIAFAKLGNCPGVSMIKTLRSILKPEEILSLVYLLRVELVKGAWTARYLDNTDFEEDASLDAPPDGIIKLLADLLGCCVDSIGPGGWLLNDAILAGDDSGDFIASLKLEVSAALEGLEEAVYLRGIVGESLRYFEAAQLVTKKSLDLTKPISLQVKEPGSEMLPLGMKTKPKIERKKVISGGEIVQRSSREQGHLRSQQVGPYSLERIAI